MKRLNLIYLGLLLAIVPSTLRAQGVTNLGENVNYFDTTGSEARFRPFSAESLYLGAPFLRDTSKVFQVWWEYTSAAWNGYLFLMYPDGSRDTLIANHPGACGGKMYARTFIDLTARTQGKIHNMDTVFFMYQTVDDGNCSFSDLHTPRYSGPNRSPLDLNPNGTPMWQNTDRYWSADVTNRPPDYGNNNYNVGRRYCVAGWIHNHVNGVDTRSDTVEFSFEDGGDVSFNDIRFKVVGLFLIRPFHIDTIILNALPNIDTIPAGDSIVYHAILQGTDSLNKIDTLPDDTANKYVTWQMIPLTNPNSANPPLRKGNGPSATNTFFATEAYQQFKIVITYSKGTVTLSTSKIITVVPGPPDHIVIEAQPGLPATDNSLNNDNPISSVTISSTQVKDSVYAVVRDAYGNLIGPDTVTNWSVTSGPTLIGAASGNTRTGQGIITKLGPSGTAVVQAQDRNHAANPKFTTTVQVNIDAVAYDSLRIVNTAGTMLQQLAINLTQDTVLIAQGQRADGLGWVNVAANWSLTLPLGSSVPPPQGNSTWNAFTPTVLGNGTISITLGSLSGSIAVTVKPGGPDHIVLYSQPWNRANISETDQNKYGDPGVSMYPVTAGASFPMYAEVFDPYHTWLAQYDTNAATANASISWAVIDLRGNPVSPTIGRLSSTTGNFVSFSDTMAYDTFYIVTTFKSGTWGPFRDSVRVTTVPANVSYIDIEGDSTPNMNVENRLSLIQMPNNADSISVYAVLRDKYNNFVSFADSTSWFSRDSTVVSSHMGIHYDVGQGIIIRITSNLDSTFVLATYQGFSDSVKVEVLNIYYTALRIVNAAGNPIDTVELSTNDSTQLFVQGFRSDGRGWENVSANWEFSTGLSMSPLPPNPTQNWKFSPNAPDTGWIRVTMGNDLLTKPDTAVAIFLRGAPLSATLQMITPANQRIAGDTLIAIAQIRNADGLVPGQYCYNGAGAVIYNDVLGSNGRPNPTATTTEQSNVLGMPVNECFNNGIDTVKFVLYYAPTDRDSTHQISVHYGNLPASTDPFVLLPAAINSLVLQNDLGVPLTGPDTLISPNGYLFVKTAGYDIYGNSIGVENANWNVSGNLDPLSSSINQSQIFYVSTNAIANESGDLCAKAVTDTSKGACIPVVIIGPLTHLIAATTRDLNGDGFLDRIDIVFNKKVSISSSFAGFSITRGTVTWAFDSVKSVSGLSSDSLWYIYLREDTTNVPQSAWTPYVAVSNLQGVAADRVVAHDGAPPVVWRVTKTQPTNQHSDDIVTIYMSEKIYDSTGAQFTIDHAPIMVFHVWLDSIIPVDSMLQNIPAFTGITGDSILQFKMTNGNDLTSSHFVNIDATNREITDDSLNFPTEINRRVRVEVGPAPPAIYVFPNPSAPTFKHVPAGEILIQDEPHALQWVTTDMAGSVISARVTIPDSGNLKAYLKIYDAVGNLVISNWNANLLSNVPRTGSTYNVDIYWNGSNGSGMKVAPGIYKAVMYLSYDSKKYPDTRLSKNLGIGK